MIPKKLKIGDEIRVIAPSISMNRLKADIRNIAINNLVKLGYKVTIGKNCYETGIYDSASVDKRIEDIHDAFSDKNVKCILTVLGGFNSNQLLDYIDYDLIKNNPKIMCGYSDITALSNAIYKMTGLVTYSGPHFSTFGMKLGNEYTIEYFQKCLFNEEPLVIEPSEKWSDEDWYLHQEDRNFFESEKIKVINEGMAKGTIIGGNLCTLNLLQGTKYMPDLKDSILFLEEDKLSMPVTFDRDLQSLIQIPEFIGVKGLVIGKFQIDFNLKKEELVEIIKSKKELDNIPIIADVNFGHTSPIFTFPIGGTVEINANKTDARIEIINH